MRRRLITAICGGVPGALLPASLGLALVAIAALPGPAHGAVVRMTPESDLRIDGFEALEERITVRYEAVGGGGGDDRLGGPRPDRPPAPELPHREAEEGALARACSGRSG